MIRTTGLYGRENSCTISIFNDFSIKNRVVMQEQQGRLGKLPKSSGKQPVTVGKEIYLVVRRFISRVC
jgi:hypothetical protein